MSNVWICIPSARPAAEANLVLAKWRERGYKIALWRDSDLDVPIFDLVLMGEYPGYARAVNALAKEVLERDAECQWIVTGGDDVEPDPNHTVEEIAQECSEYFAGRGPAERVDTFTVSMSIEQFERSRTFGVMQPTGDRYAGGCIDRIAGSPWMGRRWCETANQGQGPFWPEFTHMFSDECLKRTAERLGVYWMRPDLVHFHRHFLRRDESIDSPAVPKPTPKFLEHWNSPGHWNSSKSLFQALELQGFKPCMPTQ